MRSVCVCGGGLQLDHIHRGHGNAISFPMQSHNPTAQTFALIRHLGNPSHFISSAQINLISVLNEYAETRNLPEQDITTGKFFITALYYYNTLCARQTKQSGVTY